MPLLLTEITIERLRVLDEGHFAYTMDANAISNGYELGTAMISNDILFYFDANSDEWVEWAEYRENLKNDKLTFYTISEE